MMKPERWSDDKQEFIARTKAARKASGYSQTEMARIFGIAQDTWKQYETRTPLPHRYIPNFCTIAKVSETWLFTGKGRRAA